MAKLSEKCIVFAAFLTALSLLCYASSSCYNVDTDKKVFASIIWYIKGVDAHISNDTEETESYFGNATETLKEVEDLSNKSWWSNFFGTIFAVLAVILYLVYFYIVHIKEKTDDTKEPNSNEKVMVYIIERIDDTKEANSDEQGIPYIW